MAAWIKNCLKEYVIPAVAQRCCMARIFAKRSVSSSCLTTASSLFIKAFSGYRGGASV
ncbi:hypothetical protein [Rickettsia endosymbiont of Orchestes rusci]|uniref:hypothetical protein n=1 Tax=Rickettsia endosymbiont of Orchestes rusci TaxID=3066250 RepID=UPI00313D3110